MVGTHVRKMVVVFACMGLMATISYVLSIVTHNTKPGFVIVLDGTSTAGKSSIAKHLVKYLGVSGEVVASDDFVTDVFLKQQKTPLPQKEFLKKLCKERVRAYEKTRRLALMGKNVIFDTRLTGYRGSKEDLKGSFEQLKDLNVFLTLVYCPLALLAERIKKRVKKAALECKPEEFRPITVALKFGFIYKMHKPPDFFCFDILTREDIESSYSPPAGSSFKEQQLFRMVKINLLSQFGLWDKEAVYITPRLYYDCIVDTTTDTPHQCAEHVYDTFIASKKPDAFMYNYEKIQHTKEEL